MKEILERYIHQFQRDHQKRRKAIALFVVLSLLVSGSVTWRLKTDGIAMTNEAFCGKEEHQHTAECYQKVLTCGLEESEGHHHSKEAGCYEEQKTLTCTENEHTHGEECYDADGNLICTEAEHTHGDACYTTEDVLVCTTPESDGHTHSDSCYTEQLVCGKEEHIHTAECYSNNQADVETAADWEKTIPAGLGKNWSENVVKVAASQMGYAESTKNYQLSDADGTSHKGYTRYGAWYGNDYGDWSAMFVSFCLKYAGVPENTVPYASGAYAWTTTLTEKGMYQGKEYAAKAGDLIFLDENQDGQAERVGVVEQVSEDGKEIKVIAGDCSKDGKDVVAEVTYAADDAKIAGYGVLPENPEADGTTADEADSNAKVNENGTDETKEDGDGESAVAQQNVKNVQNTEGQNSEENAANVDENEKQDQMAVMRAEDDGAAVQNGDEDLGYDFSKDITSGIVYVLKDGNWVATTKVEDGQGVKVNLSYLLPKDTLKDDQKRIFYQLPKGIKPLKEESGSVYQNGNPVGTYKITTNGLITIDFNDQFVDGNAFSGNIEFQGEASLNDIGTPGDIDFGGNGGTISIDKKPDIVEHDIKTTKSAVLSEDGTKVSYTIVASTTKGTESTVMIQDKFQAASATGKYDESTMKIYRVDANGNQSELSGYAPTYQTEDGRETFTINNLPKLEAGEQYIISYDAEVTPTNGDGSGTVKNAAGSKSGNDEEWKWVDTEVAKSMISKSGSYNVNKNVIQWTINLNQGKKDLNGWTLKDTMMAGESNVDLPSTVTIKGADGNSREISLPHTFSDSDGLDLKQSFSITYETENPTNNTKYENTTKLEKDGKTYESGKIGVDVKYREWEVKKSGPSEDGKIQEGKQKYTWDAEVVIPRSVDYETFLYTDELQDAKNTTDDSIQADSHYALASELNEKFTNGNGLVLKDGDDKNINDKVDFIIKYYDKDGTEIPASDNTAKVKKFTIAIAPKAGQSVDAVKLVISKYPTIVDYTGMSIQDTWSFENTAKIPNHEVSKQGTYTKPNPISKMVYGKDQWNNRGYLKNSGSLSYTEEHGILKYRVKWNNETGTNEELTFVDILPENCTLVENSVQGYFYENDYYYYQTNGNYDFGGAQKVEALSEKQSDGTMKVTFKIKSGYNAGNENKSLLVDYEVKVAWTDQKIESQDFKNTISWNGYSDEQTTTVTKEIDKTSKVAKQITKTDENGKIIYTNIVEYAVTINPAGQNLNQDSDRLELSDTLKMDSGVEAYLDLEHTKLYAYDPEQENGCGQEIDPARYQISFDQKTHKLDVNLPDELACVLIYRYSIDYGTAAQPTLKNSVNLNGNWPASNDFKLHVLSSSAYVVKGKLTIYKVDSKDYSKKLQGAVFKLEKWNIVENEWTEVNTDSTVINGEYTTNDKGELVFTSASQNTPLELNTLYRLTEKTAPTGYQKKEEPDYFVLMKPLIQYDTGDRTQTIQALARRDTQAAFNAAGISQDVASFFDAEKEVSMYVPNEYNSLSVKKVWTDVDGGTLNRHPDSVTVNLYKQNTKLDSYTVTLNFKTQDGAGTKQQSISVQKGSPLTIVYKEVWNATISRFSNEGLGVFKKHISAVNGDMTIEAIGSWKGEWCPTAEFTDYTEPQSVFEGDPVLVNSVELNDINDWSYVWHNLDCSNGEVYYIKEENVPEGYEVSYNNNNGIQKGEIVVTNKKKTKGEDYTLPETGGSGTNVYTASGLAMMLAAGLMYRKKKKKEMQKNA